MRKTCYIGIDTSNYTTSLAFCNDEGEIVANLKIPLGVKSGEKGLRQSDAVFLHTKNLPMLFSEAEKYFRQYEIKGVGVSVSPRSCEGSYMPCFLAGKASAYSIARALDVPLCELSHQNGHVMAAAYSGKMPEDKLKEDFLAFHVSGGTTEVLLVSPHGIDFECTVVGGTKDINAGQAIDRVGVMMGLDFPCGPELEKLATEYKGDLFKSKICVNDGYCNLSGLENNANKLFNECGDKSKTAAYVLSFIGQTLQRMTEDVKKKYSDLPIVYSGGVMSCKLLQDMLKGDDRYFAQPCFSSDNAAGIALLCRRYLKK